MSKPRYTCTLSAPTSSPFTRRARASAAAVLPTAVGPTIARSGSRTGSASKALFQLGKRQRAQDRSTVRAVPLEVLHLVERAQQRGALVVRQRLARADRGVTRHRRERHVERIRKRTLAGARQLGQHVAQQAGRRCARQQHRPRAPRDRAGPEPRALETDLRELLLMLLDERCFELGTLDALGK